MTLTCKHAGRDEPRLVIGRHEDECADDQCPGCQECTEIHCLVCGVEHLVHEQTCPNCITETRERLKTLYGLHKHLGSEARNGSQNGRLAAARPIPGGEATVLRSGGSHGRAVSFSEEYNLLATNAGLRTKDTSHKTDERHGEPLPTLQLIDQWEDVWRAQLGNPLPEPTVHWRAHAGSPTAGRNFLESAKFMNEHLSWAAQHTASFGEFVRDIVKQATILEDVLHDGIRLEKGAPCFRCGTVLERDPGEPKLCRHSHLAQQIADHYDEPGFTFEYLSLIYDHLMKEHIADCDQGGRADTYQCPQCFWRYDKNSYWLAVREEIEREKAATQAAAIVADMPSILPAPYEPWQEEFLHKYNVKVDQGSGQ